MSLGTEAESCGLEYTKGYFFEYFLSATMSDYICSSIDQEFHMFHAFA